MGPLRSSKFEKLVSGKEDRGENGHISAGEERGGRRIIFFLSVCLFFIVYWNVPLGPRGDTTIFMHAKKSLLV